MIRPLLIAFLVAVAAMPAPAAALTWNEAKHHQVLRLMESQTVPGTSIAVGLTINGAPVLETAVGWAAPGRVATGHTAYHIGSLTKQFTAAAVLALAEDGAIVPYNGRRFGLDEPVESFFVGVEHWPPMTVRDLLTMSAGFPDYLNAPPPPGISQLWPVDRSALLAWIKTFPASRVPAYCNACYFPLAGVIDVLSTGGAAQDNYRTYLRERIFAAAGMKEAGFLEEPPPSGDLALGHGTMPGSQPAWPRGAGDIVASAADLNRWNLALFNGEVISGAGVAMMTAPNARIAACGGAPYGMGWCVGPGQAWHSGLIEGFTAFNAYFKDPGNGSIVTIALLTNIQNHTALEHLAQSILAVLQQ